MNRIKSRLFCILVALAMVVASSPGEADLINPVLNVSTPTDFSATLEDTVTTNALVTGANAHWRVMIVQFSFDAGPADDIVVFGRHRVGPHAGDVAPNPNAMAALLLNVVPAGLALRYHTTGLARQELSQGDTAPTDSAVAEWLGDNGLKVTGYQQAVRVLAALGPLLAGPMIEILRGFGGG